VIALTIFLIACDGSSSSSSSAASSGQFTLDITDGPVDNASKVVIAFTAIEVKPKSGPAQTIHFNNTKNIDLLDYQGANFISLLNKRDLETGDYNWLRLIIDDSETYIRIDGQQHELDIPSGSESGLKLNSGFTIDEGTETHIVIDFELRHSVYQTGNGNYKMKPVIRQVNPIKADTLRGVVDAALVLDVNCNNAPNNSVGNAVYLFADHNSDIQDIRGNNNDPLTTAAVTYDDNDGLYRFSLGFVPHGKYTLVFTCDGELDQPYSVDQNVSFSDTLNVSVVEDTDSVVLE